LRRSQLSTKPIGMRVISHSPRWLAALGVTVAVVATATVAHAVPAYEPPPVVEAPPAAPGRAKVPPPFAHEVWVLDQSNTAGNASYGGRIHIYDGDQLRTRGASANVEVVELGDAAARLCHAKTGANPVRPHMAALTRDGRHAVIAFVVSGHTLVMDAERRAPLACFRSEVGAGGARQAHAAVLTPDERYILVANQNGKKLERIRADFATRTFEQEPTATLDLGNGLTPNGHPVETPGNPNGRPDNAPICPFVPQSGFPAYVSLRGGGMFAVDPYATPMTIVAEYDATVVARDGCGFVEAGNWVYANGGNSPGKPNGWFVYRLPIGGPATYSATKPPNTPAVELVDRDDAGPRDTHGVAVAGGGKYVWMLDRVAHVAEVYDSSTGAKLNSLNLRSRFSQQPALDIVGISPDERFLYAANRGPRPLSGAHAATGTTPGVMVLELLEGGRTGAVRAIAPITNLVNGDEFADPHGIAVRRTSSPAPRATPPVKRSIRVNPALVPAWSASIYCEI
jgi:hypothetical protein